MTVQSGAGVNGYQLSIQTESGEQRLQMVPGTSVLSGLQQLGLSVRKACRNGGCGVCRCRLVAGEISYGERHPFGLWQKDIDDGVILPCIAVACSDLRLDELSLDEGR